jgi:hypothetical protein
VVEGSEPGSQRARKILLFSPAERERRREIVRAIEAVVPEAFKGDAYDLLVSVYKDPSYPLETRLAAAANCTQRANPNLVLKRPSTR